MIMMDLCVQASKRRGSIEEEISKTKKRLEEASAYPINHHLIEIELKKLK